MVTPYHWDLNVLLFHRKTQGKEFQRGKPYIILHKELWTWAIGRFSYEVFRQKVWTITNPRDLWFWKYELFDLLAILTFDPLVDSFSKKFYTFFLPYNKVLIGINFPKISFLPNLCPADHPGQVSLEVVCQTHFSRNAVIWKFMMIKTFFYDTQKL